MQTFLQDFRYGVRMLLKDPGFTIIAVVTLSLGIGVNTAVFSVVNGVLLRPLPYAAPERLALVQQHQPKLGWYYGGVSAPEWLDYRDGNQTFAEMAAYNVLSLNLTGEGEPQRLQAARVSPGLFPLLGVTPLVGRGFSLEEDEVGKNRVIVLSDKGELMVAEASADSFKPISRAQVLSGKCWSVPVLANGKIYCRNAAGDVVCVDVSGK